MKLPLLLLFAGAQAVAQWAAKRLAVQWDAPVRLEKGAWCVGEMDPTGRWPLYVETADGPLRYLVQYAAALPWAYTLAPEAAPSGGAVTLVLATDRRLYGFQASALRLLWSVERIGPL